MHHLLKRFLSQYCIKESYSIIQLQESYPNILWKKTPFYTLFQYFLLRKAEIILKQTPFYTLFHHFLLRKAENFHHNKHFIFRIWSSRIWNVRRLSSKVYVWEFLLFVNLSYTSQNHFVSFKQYLSHNIISWKNVSLLIL